MNKLSDEVGKSLNSMEKTINLSNNSKISSNPINSIINNTPAIGETIKTSSQKSLEAAKTRINDSASSIKSIIDEQSEKSRGFMSKIFSFNSIIFWILLIFVLAFLGLNIFTYLSQGTETLTDIFQPIVNLIGNLTGETSKTTINETSSGTQKIIDGVSETSKTIVDSTSKGSTAGINAIQSSLKKNTSSVTSENDDKLITSSNNEPEAIQTNTLQSGYCYIGKINDTRYCAKVESNSKCMSGDIYPSMDICINPNLRN